MIKHSTIRVILMALAVVLFSTAMATATSGDKKTKARKTRASQTACSKTSDADLVQAIKAQFEADAEIKAQMRHVNVSV